MTKALKYLYGGVFLWYPAVTLIRISIACTLMRLQRWSKTWTIILWVTIVLQILVGTYGELFAFLQCRPLRALWEPVPGAKCWVSKSSLVGGWIFSGMKHTASKPAPSPNLVSFRYANTSLVTSMLNDTLFALMPISLIWKLRRPLPERILISCLMALGLTSAFCAIMKTVKWTQMNNVAGDVMRNVLNISLWARLEESFGLVAACAPTLKRPGERLLQRLGILGSHAKRYFNVSLHSFATRISSFPNSAAQTNSHASKLTTHIDVFSTESNSSSKYASPAVITVSELPMQGFGHDENGRTESHGFNAV